MSSTSSNPLDTGTEPVVGDSTSFGDQSLNAIESHACELSSESSSQDMLVWLDRSAWLLERAKSFRHFIEQAAIAWIKENGDLQLGHLRFTITQQKVTRCVDVRGATDALLGACGGDLGQFSQLLAANPFKYGACRSLLSPADYASLFVIDERAKLTDGRSAERLLRVDTRFATNRAED